jgi:hypothetical protein
MGRLQVHVGNDHQMRAGPGFDLCHLAALFIEQVCGNVERNHRADHRAAVFQGFLFHDPQDAQRQRTDIAYPALAAATGADLGGQLVQRGAKPLAGHFHQAETGDAANLDPGAIGFQGFAHLVLDRALVLHAAHVDEVDYQQASNITQSQLAGNFFRCF